ncbi:AraC family transcriptional regulator [Nocardia sp. NPDC050406]|uniref:AraC family transcriptional regulator n=1 Tax=Nocardia sp. NPDC050406 TaxID=3364318 RepID=UPI0037ABC2FE
MAARTADYTVPIARVQSFVALALRRGWDIDTMMRAAGISPVLLAQGRSRVTLEQASALIRQLWAVTDDELLGLGRMAVPRGTFRLVGSAVLATADNIGTALERYVEFNKVIPGTPEVYLARSAGETVLAVDLDPLDRPIALLVDAMLATGHRLLEWATGRRIALRRVEVPYPEPEDVDDYDLIFGAPMVFEVPRAAVVLDNTVLPTPLVRDESELDQFIDRAPADLLVRRDGGISLSDRVRRVLVRDIGHEWSTTEQLAARFAMSPQTLRRKLRAEGTSIREIREGILRDAAIDSLTRGTETIAALSQRLGFSEPSAFTRAFRRWTGSAPRSYLPRGHRD